MFKNCFSSSEKTTKQLTFLLGPFHTETIAYHSKFFRSKKWYTEGLFWHLATKSDSLSFSLGVDDEGQTDDDVPPGVYESDNTDSKDGGNSVVEVMSYCYYCHYP